MVLLLRRFALVLALIALVGLMASAICLLDEEGGPDLCQVALAIGSLLALAPLLQPTGEVVPLSARWRPLDARDLRPPPPRV